MLLLICEPRKYIIELDTTNKNWVYIYHSQASKKQVVLS